jgi:hypothetical protein
MGSNSNFHGSRHKSLYGKKGTQAREEGIGLSKGTAKANR